MNVLRCVLVLAVAMAMRSLTLEDVVYLKFSSAKHWAENDHLSPVQGS